MAWEEDRWNDDQAPDIDKTRMQELYLDAIEFGESTLSELADEQGKRVIGGELFEFVAPPIGNARQPGVAGGD